MSAEPKNQWKMECLYRKAGQIHAAISPTWPAAVRRNEVIPTHVNQHGTQFLAICLTDADQTRVTEAEDCKRVQYTLYCNGKSVLTSTAQRPMSEDVHLMSAEPTPQPYVLATPRNMRTHPGYTAVSLYTDEEYSGNAGDYFLMGEDDALLDDEDEPMLLAKKVCRWEFAQNVAPEEGAL